jgi:hypothetical protein
MSNLDDDQRLMQPVKVPMRPLALRYGLMIGLALFVIGLLLQFSGVVDPVEQKGTSVNMLVGVAILLGGLYIAVREYKKESGNLITFGRALGFGTLTLVFICLVTFVTSWLNFTVIDPGMVDQIREMSDQRMREQGMDDDAIEQAKGMLNIFTSPIVMSIMGAIFFFFFGFICALITAAIHNNAKPAANI